MHRMTTVVLIAATCLVGMSARAFAQGDDNGSGSGDASGSGSGDASASGDADANGSGAGSAEMAPAQVWTGGWSTAISDRPLVLDQSKLDIHANLPILAISLPDGMGGTSTSTGVGLGVGVNYGVAPKLEAGLDYNLSLKEFDATGNIVVHAAYGALHQAKMDLALAATVAIDLHSGNNAALTLGAWFRYKIAPKFSIFTGNPGLPFGGPSSAGQLSIGLNNGNNVALALPVGVGIQASPQLFAFLSTTIANIGISPSGSTFIFSDFVPVTVGAFFSPSNKLDVGLTFSDDLKNAGDFYIFALSARFFVK